MALNQLLQTVSTEAFLEQYFFKLPYSSRGGAESFRHVGDWSTVERLITHPDVDLLIASSRNGVYHGEQPTNLVDAKALFSDGYTLGFRHAQNCDQEIANLCAEFSREFAAPVDIHLYCTPAGEPGFGWHYDAEEVFILQTSGSKQWSLRKNTVNPWPLIETLPQDMAYHRELMPLMRCDLAEGDWLYIPGGYWHSTAADADSISLSVGLNCRSGIDVYDFLRAELLDDIRWRGRLPVAGTTRELSPEQLAEQYREHIEELAADLARKLASSDFVDRFLRQYKESWTQRPGDSSDSGDSGTASCGEA